MIHVNRPQGYFLGQVRRYGGQNWETVTGRCMSAEGALSKALLCMKPTDFRARALFVDSLGWYDSRVVMEAKR